MSERRTKRERATLSSQMSAMSFDEVSKEVRFELSDEAVPNGCLSQNLSKHLERCAKGKYKHEMGGTATNTNTNTEKEDIEYRKRPSNAAIAVHGVLVLTIPALLNGAMFSLMPFDDPSKGFEYNTYSHVSYGVLICVLGIGLTPLYLMPLAMELTKKNMFLPGTLSSAISYSFYLAIAKFVVFPVPFGFIIIAGISAGAQVIIILIIKLGARNLLRKSTIVRVAPLVGLGITAGIYVVVFGFFRALFESLEGRSQILLAPIWPLVKLFFKHVAARLTEMGNNADVAPFVFFCFDAISAMSANFLFISANSIASVLPMIFVDVIENLFMGMRILYFRMKARTNRIKMQQVKEKKGRVEISKAIDGLRRRLAKLENSGRTGEGDNNEVDVKVQSIIDTITTDEGFETDSVGDSEDDGEEGGRGAERVLFYKKKALRLILSLLASEYSEIITSCFALIMLPMLYYSDNRANFFTLDTMSENRLQQSLLYSFVDLLCEATSSFLIMAALTINLEWNVFEIGIGYLGDKRGMGKSIFLTCVTICGCSFAFFLKIGGVKF